LKSNVASLEQEGGLHIDQLPQTIQDAMILMSQIQERYLWVDSLCIVQDDKDVKRSQIATMNQIYQGAYATIIAASGNDANAGLPGVRSGTRRWLQNMECARSDTGQSSTRTLYMCLSLLVFCGHPFLLTLLSLFSFRAH
jgi:hypothetical protein